MTIQILILLAGLLLILFGANYLVDGSSSIAKKLGLSEFVIGLTVVGIGTSAPEMVVSFMSSFQGKADMAIGNIVGSNIFNILAILGVAPLIAPIKSAGISMIDMYMMLGVSILLIAFMKTLKINRYMGAFFLLIYTAYTVYLFYKG